MSAVLALRPFSTMPRNFDQVVTHDIPHNEQGYNKRSSFCDEAGTPNEDEDDGYNPKYLFPHHPLLHQKKVEKERSVMPTFTGVPGRDISCPLVVWHIVACLVQYAYPYRVFDTSPISRFVLCNITMEKIWVQRSLGTAWSPPRDNHLASPFPVFGWLIHQSYVDITSFWRVIGMSTVDFMNTAAEFDQHVYTSGQSAFSASIYYYSIQIKNVH